MKNSRLVSASLGNIFEHFDKALYALLSPYIAYLFFPKMPAISALFIIFFPFGWVIRPIGAYFIGKIAVNSSKEKALYFSVIGISTTCFFIAVLPTYSSWGIYSPVILVVLRTSLSVFSSGETTGSALIILESNKNKSKELLSSYYEVTGVIGSLLAIFSVAFLVKYNLVENYWRILYLLGSLFGLYSYFKRAKWVIDTTFQREKLSIKMLIKNHTKSILFIALITGFSYANYDIIVSLMTVFLPVIKQMDYFSMLLISGGLMFIDLLLLPLFGWVAIKIGHRKLMAYSLILFILLGPVCFWHLAKASFHEIFLLRLVFVMLGVAFAAPFQYFAKQLAGEKNTFAVLSVGKAIGAQCLGYPSIALSLYIYSTTGITLAMVFYPAILSLASLMVIKYAGSNFSRVASVTNAS